MYMCVTVSFLDSNNFATSVTSTEVCYLLSAIPVVAVTPVL